MSQVEQGVDAHQGIFGSGAWTFIECPQIDEVTGGVLGAKGGEKLFPVSGFAGAQREGVGGGVGEGWAAVDDPAS